MESSTQWLALTANQLECAFVRGLDLRHRLKNSKLERRLVWMSSAQETKESLLSLNNIHHELRTSLEKSH